MARKYLFLTLLLAIVLFYLNIGGISIYILDEAKNATCAKEMFFRSDIVVPTFNGALRGDKPPLHYYFMMAAYTVFGVTPFAARFFSSFMGVMVFMVSVGFVRRYFGNSAALWTAITIISSFLFVLEFHLSVPDPYLIAFFLMANISLFISYYERKRLWLIPGYIFLALAVLAKGPVALVMSVLGWLMYVLFYRLNLVNTIRFFRLHWGILILAIVTLPWFLAVHFETQGEWTRAFFLDHNINRFTSTKEGHGGIPLMSVLLLLAVMLPGGVFIPRIAWHVLRYRPNQIAVFLVCLGLAPMIFFLFSQTVLPNYIMPGVPFLTMAIGIWLFRYNKEFKFREEFLVLIFVSILIPVAAYFGLTSDPGLEGLELQSLWLTVAPVFSIIAIGLYKSKPRQAFLWIASGYIVMFTIITVHILPKIDSRNPVRLSTEIWKMPVHKRYFRRINPSYLFYFSDPVKPMKFSNDVTVPEPVLIFSRSEYSDTLRNLGYTELFRHRNLFERGETIIYGSRILQSGDVTSR